MVLKFMEFYSALLAYFVNYIKMHLLRCHFKNIFDSLYAINPLAPSHS